MKTILRILPVVFALFSGLPVFSQASDAWWGESVEKRLPDAATNRSEIVKALNGVPAARREAMAFLVENMPVADLKTLSSSFLVDNVNLAWETWEQSPFHDKVSKDLFLNDVLPYAVMSEPRDSWRKQLHDLCAPIVAGCKTPGEAGLLLNQKIFSILKVRYDTARKRPDQSPKETMDSGIATCSGLSILLVDACRAAGVPARVAGTPMWTNMRGNHTWAEIWNDGWHFVGAAEPDPTGFDRGWFVHDAALARRDVPEHGIYASSFRHTDTPFPMVWAPDDKSVSAVNVTERYAAKTEASSDATARLLVNVVDANGKRMVADVSVSDGGTPPVILKDKSRGATNDMNDYAAFKVVPGKKQNVTADTADGHAEVDVTMAQPGERIVTLMIRPKTKAAEPKTCAPPAALAKPLSSKATLKLRKELMRFFVSDPDRQARWKFSSKQEKLLKENESAVREIAWKAYRDALIHTNLKSDFDAHIVNFETYRSPYTVKTVGTRPEKGWALFIAMHGGGNAPQEVNDQQWRHMQIYYKDHPEVGGYIYVALRAPNNTWNGFYDVYVYPLIDQLILQFRLFADIDPDKVFIMGYSHGGYGAYAIGPKMPDRFAAIHASAAAATDGETTPKTLRTTPFTAMVGELDKDFGRYERNLKFKAEVEKLRGSRTDIYPVTVTVISGNAHTGLPDRDKIVDMYPAVRNPVPREMDWLMTDSVIKDFFWLHVAKPAKEQEIFASCHDNRFVVTANATATNMDVFMDSRLVDYSKPVDIELNGSTTTLRFAPSLKTFCMTLARRGDPGFAFSSGFSVVKSSKTGGLVVEPIKD